MDLGLRGKVALVTASSKGIGRACAYSLAQEGASVAICARGREELEKTAHEIQTKTGSPIFPIVADLTSRGDIERLVNTVVERLGQLNILVTNNGGPPAGYFDDFGDEAWESAFRLTLLSVVRLLRVAIPHLESAKWGRVINLTSISVREPIDNLVLSNVIRPSVHGLSKSLTDHLAQKGIAINNVMPGYIRTERVISLAASLADERRISIEEALGTFSRNVPLGRIGEPEEVGDFVAFLASPRSGYITGQSFLIDGGRFRGLF